MRRGGYCTGPLDQHGPPRGDTRPTSPTSIDLTTAVSGRRLAGALVLGPGVSSWQTRRLNSLNSLNTAEGGSVGVKKKDKGKKKGHNQRRMEKNKR